MMPLLVRGLEGVGDLLGDGQGIGEGDASFSQLRMGPHPHSLGLRTLRPALRPGRRRSVSVTRDDRRQVVALDEFHHQRARVAGLLDAVNRGDVRMIQRREGFRFAREARDPIRVQRKRLRQHLDRHGATELHVGRAIDLAHAASADGGDDLIWAESSPCGEWHGLGESTLRNAAGARPSRGSGRSWPRCLTGSAITRTCSQAASRLIESHVLQSRTVRRIRLAEEGRTDDVARLAPSERVAMMWQLALQAWMFKEGLVDEPRLRRDAVRVVRGRR